MDITSTKPLKIFNASAGSGKTYTLVQEYLRIVLHSENPLKFQSILAMTFTNKAANEMKERILEGLIQLGKPVHDKNENELAFLIDTSKNMILSPSVVEERSAKILNRILHNYSAFSIMTIDKFTHKVIRTFAKDLNISIDFDVELDLQKLRKNVTDLLFDQIGRDKDLTALMMRYANTNLADDKSWNFSKQLYDFSNEIFKEEAIKAIDLLKKLSPADFLKVQNDLILENKKIGDSLIRNAQEALDLSLSKGLTASDFQGLSRSVITYFSKLAKLNEFEPPSDQLRKYVEANKWGHEKSPNKSIADGIGDLLGQYFNQILTVFEGPFKTYIINKEILKNLNNLSLLNHLVSMVEQIKEEENILLISDFYKKIAEIITEEPVPFIYERLGVRYQHFLLDEFQDTSYMQWINMIPLVHNSLASKNSNLIVGDGKQAIYRWRNGEVEQFTGLPNHILNPDNIASLREAEPLFKALGEKYPLKQNFRSAPEIVNFNNDLFSTLIKSLPENLRPIYEDILQESTQNFLGYVEGKFRQTITPDEQLDFVYTSIQKALENNFDLKDICVLTRNNIQGSEISRFLTENGIKIISQESLFIGKDLNVKFIANLIASIINPTNKNFKIKTLEHFSTLILKEEARITIEKHTSDIEKRDIISILKDYNYTLVPPHQFHNLFEFVSGLINAFDLTIGANPFLQFLLEQVHLFEKRNNSNARDFVDWYFDRGHTTSIISPDGANAVQVMTIHKSKGLQFPVVICPFFDWNMDVSRQISWVENSDNSLPAYFVKISKALLDTELSETYHIENGKFLLDNLNLLYVAFTRPEVALFISGKIGTTNSPAKLWLASYFEQTSLGEFSNNVFTYGKFTPRTTTKRSTTPTFQVNYEKEVMDKPVLSYKSAENWNVYDLDERRSFGTKVHLILSQLKGLKQLTQTISQQIKKGTINKKEAELISETITNLFQDPHFAAYFDAENQLNEKEIIDLNGLKLIPDKIIQLPTHHLVVDFKTGQETPAHTLQVRKYLSILNDMGFKNLKGELYYTEEQRFVLVEFN